MPKISCPNCKKDLFYRKIEDLPYFPFCSDRCKLIDFGEWLDGSHRIEEPINWEVLRRMEENGEDKNE